MAGVIFDGIKRPRIQVLAGFGASPDPGTGYIHLNVGPGLGTGLLAGASADVDITADVRSISISLRGRESDIDAANPVTCQIVLSNRHGNYDPSYTAGPYFGNLEDGTPIKVRESWAGTAYDHFTGELSDITLDLDTTPDATATFACADGFENLGRAYLPVAALSRDGDTTGQRISFLADQAIWPSALRSIDTGFTDLGPTILGESALELMRKVESTEFGLLFVDGSGRLVFYDRYKVTTATRSTTVQATFADTGGTAVGIAELSMSRSRARTFNRVAITREPIPSEDEEAADEPVEQVADDPVSQATKGILAFPAEVGQLLRSDEDALAMAQGLLDRFSAVTNRISGLEVNALRGQWGTLLALGPLDRIAVSRDYGPNTITSELLIQGVAEEITVNPPSWTLSFSTTPPITAPSAFILGTDQVGVDALGW